MSRLAGLLSLLAGGRRKRLLRELFARRIHAQGVPWDAGMEQSALQGAVFGGSPEETLLQIVEAVAREKARGLSLPEAIAAEEARRRRRGAEEAAFAEAAEDLGAYVAYRLRLEQPRATAYRDPAFTAESVAFAEQALG